MTRGKTTAKGARIGALTHAYALRLTTAREHYWRALLARPQLAAPIVHAVRLDVETDGWDRRLACLEGFARAMVATRRKAEAGRYEAACGRAARWLAKQDRGCEAANACHEGIALWAGRRLPGDHRWSEHRIYPARVQSQAWRHYWQGVDQARSKREDLRNKIVTTNEGLVIMLVTKWVPWAVGHLTREDCQQAGREGLFRAADLFEPERGFKFSTYASQWVRHHVFRLFQLQRSDVKAPIGIQQLALAIAPAVEFGESEPERLQAMLRAKIAGRTKAGKKPKNPPSIDAITAALEYLGIRQVSMDATVTRTLDGRGLTLAEVVADPSPPQDERLDYDRVIHRLLAAVQDLDPRDRRVVESRYGLRDGPEMSAAQVAAQLGRAREEIEAVERGVLLQLRGRMRGAEHVSL